MKGFRNRSAAPKGMPRTAGPRSRFGAGKPGVGEAVVRSRIRKKAVAPAAAAPVDNGITDSMSDAARVMAAGGGA